jgi:predicted O-methyltransferase YrrM
MLNINEFNRSSIKQKIVNNPQSCVFPWAIQFVIDTIKTLPTGSTILEIGTFVGGTTRLFAQANPNIKIHTIDIDEFGNTDLNPEFGDINTNPMVIGVRESLGLLELTKEDLYEIRKMHLEDFPSVIFHSGKSRDLQLKDLDLVFIDAAHKYPEVIADLRYAWNITKEGGYIFGDDIQSPAIYNALCKFCREVDIPYTIYSKCFKIRKKTRWQGIPLPKVNMQTLVPNEDCFVEFGLSDNSYNR